MNLPSEGSREEATRSRRFVLFSWGTLDTYVLRHFAFIYVANLICFSSLFVLVDLVEHLDDYTGNSESLGDFLRFIFRYYLAVLPLVFCQFLGPIICLTTGLFALTVLHRNNELIPILASGRSYRRLFLPVLIAGGIVTAASFVVQETYIPRTVETIREVTGVRQGKNTAENLKYLDAEHGLLFALRYYDSSERLARGIAVFPIGRRDEQQLIQAKSMQWIAPELGHGGHWLLTEGVVQNYRRPKDGSVPRLVPQPARRQGTRMKVYEEFKERALGTTLIPEDLELREDEVVYMSLGSLRRKMEESRDRRWTLKYYSRFAYPLGNLILLLVGLPVIVSLGGRNIFFGALVAALLAAAYFVTGSFVSDVALRGFLPAPLGAGLPVLLFTALGVTCLRYLRT